MKRIEKKDAATLAAEDMVRAMSEQDIQYALRTALHRARTWYRLKGKRFRLPKETSGKAKR
jgi:hypothetical protein